MGVNNEIGVVQPVKAIGELCRAKKVFYHSDIAQMAGKMPINMGDLCIDVASISSHKVRTIHTVCGMMLLLCTFVVMCVCYMCVCV